VLDEDPDSLCEWAIVRRKHSAVSCATMAEQMEMAFGLWTRVGPRKHVLHGVHIGATWRIRLNRSCSGGQNDAAAMRLYIKLLEHLLLFYYGFCKVHDRLYGSQVCCAGIVTVYN